MSYDELVHGLFQHKWTCEADFKGTHKTISKNTAIVKQVIKWIEGFRGQFYIEKFSIWRFARDSHKNW